MPNLFESFTHSTGIKSVNFHCSLLAILLALSSYRLLLLDREDPYHCHALLRTGRWLDGTHYQNWQPDGCMLHSYKPKEVTECFRGRRVVFIGDSVTRGLYYGALRSVNTSITQEDQPKHSDRVLQTAGGVEWAFYWDPFLNTSNWNHILSDSPIAPTGKLHKPALLVVGSGLWFLRHTVPLEAWRAKADKLFEASLDRQNIIADEIVFLPVEMPVIEKLSSERRNIKLEHVIQMNTYALQKLDSDPAYQIAIPSVNNLMTVGAEAETTDGLHYSEKFMSMQARVLLNMRCNDVLVKKFPFDKTCCSEYPKPNWIQWLFIIVLLVWAPIGLYLDQHPSTTPSNWTRFFPPSIYLMPLTVFGYSIVLIFLADRTSLFTKEQKQFDGWIFALLNLLALAVGVVTYQVSDKGDLGLLNREQTDEWKGWMQLAILIYHYLSASKISGIYNPIRICVAAYLFMTGYGHFTFFYKKKDFGLARIVGVMVRLNLLTLVLAYIMDTDYLSYYFSPLVSMWFMIIWVTMYVGHQWNDRLDVLILKIVGSAALTTMFFKSETPLKMVFAIFNRIFQTEWFANEWAFRVTLDMYIVYWGMLAALAYIKVKEFKLIERNPETWKKTLRASIILSFLGVLFFFWFELSQPSKLVYNHFHPYISIIPIASFIVLRNSTAFLRSVNSRMFMFFGQCSLETFIIQFHFWLVADTKGILIMIPWGRWRALNFILSSLVFVFISNHVAVKTGQLTEWICNKQSSKPKGNNHRPTNTTQASDYIPLPTINNQPTTSSVMSEEVDHVKEEAERTLMAVPSADRGRMGEVWGWTTEAFDKKLWFRVLVLLGGLWLLNLLYPSHAASTGHILPTH
ncbi:hypothetical protein CROQUDRAFT_104872 [Cronartium quercuum f. sp. fusiforme G11]|uniref:Cas1p 10 TM acyl transferase domain-containing protein n=1 Tax=Cronartium quercuum f. sp. fusiforme G11 TaxID=708437 RepID=A0A9P6NPB0_9BASI|nr:hypothetical protein CROQUDRAFT_104872 [Cronartium quercuum f. sp. fusiforme G11]